MLWLLPSLCDWEDNSFIQSKAAHPGVNICPVLIWCLLYFCLTLFLVGKLYYYLQLYHHRYWEKPKLRRLHFSCFPVKANVFVATPLNQCVCMLMCWIPLFVCPFTKCIAILKLPLRGFSKSRAVRELLQGTLVSGSLFSYGNEMVTSIANVHGTLLKLNIKSSFLSEP